MAVLPVFAWIASIMGVFTMYPGLWDLVVAVFGVFWDDVTHYWPIYKKRLAWAIVIYIGVLCALAVFAGFALAGGNLTGFAIVTFIMALALLPLHLLMNKFVSIVNHVASGAVSMLTPTPVSVTAIGTPKIPAVSILILLGMALMALLFPAAFLDWFIYFELVLVIFGVLVMVAWPSNRFMARTVLGLQGVVIVSIAVMQVFAAPYTEAATLQKQLRDAIQGRENLQTKLSLRPVHNVTGSTGATVYKIARHSNGDPKMREDGFPEVEKAGEKLEMGQKFKTLDVKFTSVDAGEPLVQIFSPADDGTWVQIGDVGNRWIAVSVTDLAEAEIAKDKTSPPKTSDGKLNSTAGAVLNFDMPATDKYNTKVLVRRGQRIRIQASGEVNASSPATPNDGAYRLVGPSGWGSDPGFNSGRSGPLPAGQSFMALTARVSSGEPSVVDGQWKYVGDSQVITADQDGYVYLVVNDRVGDKSGLHRDWFTNNQGGLSVQLQVE